MKPLPRTVLMWLDHISRVISANHSASFIDYANDHRCGAVVENFAQPIALLIALIGFLVCAAEEIEEWLGCPISLCPKLRSFSNREVGGPKTFPKSLCRYRMCAHNSPRTL